MQNRYGYRGIRHGAALALLLAAFGAAADPPRTVVVLTEEAAHFAEAVAGFLRQMDADSPATRVQLLTLDGDAAAVPDGADAVVTFGSLAYRAAADRPPRPSVACMMFDPPADRTVHTLGLEHPPSVQAAAIRQILPRAGTIGIVHRPQDRQRVASMTEAVRVRGLAVFAQDIDGPAHLPAALDRMANQVDAIWITPDSVLYNPQTARGLLLFSFRQRIPVIGLSEAWVRAGALLALERDNEDLGRQCAGLLLRALDGAPATAPVAPRRVIHVINPRTARHMQIDLPSGLPAPIRLIE